MSILLLYIGLGVLAYIAQVLLVLSLPYYEYRKEEKGYRTIGKFVEYTEDKWDGYIFVSTLPFVGIFIVLLFLLLWAIVTPSKCIYERYIKDIKI